MSDESDLTLKRQEQLQAERNRHWATQRVAEAPIVADLRDHGIDIDSIWTLLHIGSGYDSAVPVLLKHLRSRSYPDPVNGALARLLSVTGAKPFWADLRRLYSSADGWQEAEGLAVSLAALAGPADVGELFDLVKDEEPSFDYRPPFFRKLRKLGGQEALQFLESVEGDVWLGAAARDELRLARKAAQRRKR